MPVLLLTLGFALGQQLVWEIPASNNSGYRWCGPFGDYDQDGYKDLVAAQVVGQSTPQMQVNICVLSGRNGALLHLRPSSLGIGKIEGAGDVDGDGYDEYIWFSSGRIHIHSPRRNLELFFVPPVGPGPSPGPGQFGDAVEPHIDLDGDGLGDILGATVRSFDSSLYAYDHLGALRYVIPASVHGWSIQSIANVGDRDGDGGEDFLVGAHGGLGAEGGVFLYSGRTGTLLRFHPGLQVFDFLGGMVANAGDLDKDGVADYLASNPNGFSDVTVTWSGATGALIREWRDPSYMTGKGISASHDVDFDGVPDMLFACGSCQFGPFSWGAVQLASVRDGQIIHETHPLGSVNEYGFNVVDLGIQPGSPHPVYALTFNDIARSGGTIQLWRGEPARTTLSGTGCSTTGGPMIPGLRSIPTGARLQLASAPPGALTWCILGDGTATTTSGLPLPIALDSYGFQGCALNVPLDFVGATIAGTVGIDRGYAAFDLPLPLAATGGRRFAVQWFVLDPATGFESWTLRRDFSLR
ncbi:MAG: hypothetical protein ABL997_14560 [Planctomycetota bacterium]